jgi:hypothetical protein
MNQRIPSSASGRRWDDGWTRFGKILGVILSAAAVLAMTGQLWVKGNLIETNRLDIRELSERMTTVEKQQHDSFYMTCVMFQMVKPNDVPASCGLAVK